VPRTIDATRSPPVVAAHGRPCAAAASSPWYIRHRYNGHGCIGGPLPRAPIDDHTPYELLPLSPVVLHILLALVEGERHGYAIAQEAERVSEGRVRMGPGTLYGSIQRVLASGLIREVKPAGRDDAYERRRYYQLTAFGRRVLEAETARMAALVGLARRRGVLPAPRPA
jgi:DNA-binding PadR family transcriptional regulator